MFFCNVNRIMHDVVESEKHILGRFCCWFPRRREENIIWSHHEKLSFNLCFNREGYMNCHLVAVKVGVKCCTYKRVDTNSLTFNKNRFKSLDTETVQGRRSV